MRRPLVLTLLLLVPSCKKPAADCDGAGSAAPPDFASSVVLRCKQDGWTAAATDCVKSAKGSLFDACASTLTKDQSDKLRAGIPSRAAPSTATPSAPVAPAGPSADCAGVEAAMSAFWSGRVSTATTEDDRKAAEQMRVTARARIGKHCTEDKWSAEAASCFKAVTDGGFAACEPKLTPSQISSLKGSAPPMQGTP
jgi:hypothetical protein